MNSNKQAKAEAQLSRVLSFFSRVDAKNSALFAINTAMLGILFANLPKYIFNSCSFYLVLLPTFFIAMSIWNLYKGAFPNLKGDDHSLIFFRSVGELAEKQYVEKFLQMSEEAYIEDILRQVWRNSQILKEKFSHLKTAFIFTIIAIFPWIIVLAYFLDNNSSNLFY